METVNIYKHGEVRVIERELDFAITGKKFETKEDIILADSETTGNHHMLQVIPGVHVYRNDKLDKFFVKTEVDTKVYCKLENRHTPMSLKTGYTYEITKAKEWDHLSRERRNVKD